VLVDVDALLRSRTPAAGPRQTRLLERYAA
jgi:hypothetical protein